MDQPNNTNLRFLSVTTLNILITFFELVGGLLSGSLSLISDAFHNFSDTFSIVLSYLANVIGNKKATPKNSYGYRRAEILTALLNSIILVLISLFLLFEGIDRIQNPEAVKGAIMFWVAIISFIANLGAALLLRGGSHNNLNMKATYLHLLSDSLASIGVIIGAIFIYFFNLTWIDPVITILVSLYIAYESLPIIQQTFRILMEGSPDIDVEHVKSDLLAIPEIKDVHHFHSWSINENELMASVHVNLPDLPLSETEKIYGNIENVLKAKYNISHVTIQAECTRGLKKAMCLSNEDEDNDIRNGK
ncbi:cation diffusion facilitator family transporter [Liquorilactobacillus mali]|uniref:CDF family cation diffusion facilitator n=1 Tax=Liquorilactobacillus mali KCTC 3596 = DSM 20444 TaxID=1046596 RepID=J0L3E7_9LACO|nr:cation diffusion facilitator family transporter [Liquorilactobacillus mali]EJE97528.1 CDF family cation diffusion facilitator [Liquorilactobacillus mali KCTC 3596 = DSM 20444]KRN11228.1 CDF family cation diffusion facilitator [Liquorilactobacillus mali KCTC 3596 = DSM 20444]MDC7954129.1 cation transporter [Liquorilactobacillus mali]MDV7757708.1 cation diffusion facilitator family transporter [Liquorilactobacillus mali]QFQ73780.1 cation transporter [Liquorilactobacillus mali]